MQPRTTPLLPQRSVQKPASIKHRFLPVMDLLSCDLVGQVYENDQPFDASVSFGPVTSAFNSPCPAEWLGLHVEDALVLASGSGRKDGPIHIAAPVPALSHPDSADACEAAVRRARACPQEICLDFDDTAFVDSGADATTHVSALRRRGFRVGIDARRSWQSATTPTLRMLIDTVRITARQLDTEQDLVERVLSVAEEGVAIMADGARWRDSHDLCELGVSFATAPRADA
ncbi:MAG: EAL domain-containing protein [Pseudomonadota bacterium]